MCLDLRNSYFRNCTEVEEFLKEWDYKTEYLYKFAYDKKLLQQWREIKELGI